MTDYNTFKKYLKENKKLLYLIDLDESNLSKSEHKEYINVIKELLEEEIKRYNFIFG